VISWLVYSPFLALALVAQWSDRYRSVRWVTYGAILLFDALTALAGLMALGIEFSAEMQNPLISKLPGLGSSNWGAIGLVLVGAALLSPISLLPVVRRGLSRLIPIDPGSAIHATALALAILAMGLTISQVPLIGGLTGLPDRIGQISFLDWLASNVPIGLFALVGVGFLVRRKPRETWERLGLARITWRQAGLTVGLTVMILVFYYGADWAWRALAPENYERMEALGEALFGGFTWYQAIGISLVAAVTEELLFRGALQPRFGFLLTAALFTGVHVQYGLTPATLEVLGGALALGWLRQRANTSACILLHLLYNAAGLLIFPLLP